MEVGGIAGDQLKAFVDRYEHVQEGIDDLNRDKSGLMGEVEGAGFDKKVFRILLKRRRMGKDACDEEDTMVELYERALEAAPARSRARARTRKRPNGAEEAGTAPGVEAVS
jgi:uncharacterized protein (UPF0335 family)